MLVFSSPFPVLLYEFCFSYSRALLDLGQDGPLCFSQLWRSPSAYASLVRTRACIRLLSEFPEQLVKNPSKVDKERLDMIAARLEGLEAGGIADIQ